MTTPYQFSVQTIHANGTTGFSTNVPVLVLYRRLLERHQTYEKQLAEVGAGLQEEMEELLTPDEKEKVTSIKRSIAK